MRVVSTRLRSLAVAGAAGAMLVLPVLVPSSASAATTISAVSIKSVDKGAVIAAAQAASGGKYRRGGTTPAGFDCSGFTRYVYAQVGVSLPRDSRSQRAATARISAAEAVPGDLVFFHKGKKGRVYHVAIYAGNGMVYHASTKRRPVGLGPIFSSNISFGRV